MKDGKDGKFAAEREEQHRDRHQFYAHNREQFLRLIRSNLFSKRKKEINDS